MTARLLALLVLTTAVLHAQPSASTPAALGLRFDQITVGDGLPASSVNAVVQDRQGFVWIGTDGGLARTDGVATTVFRHDVRRPSTLPNDRVNALLVDRAGRLWVGTDGGLARFDARTGTFVTLTRDPVESIYQDRARAVWVGTRGGALRLAGGRARRFRHVPAAGAGTRTDWVMSFAEDARGGLWVGTRQGLSRLDRLAGYLVRVPLRTEAGTLLRPSDVPALVPDGRALWFGSGRTLYRVDPATRTARTREIADLWPPGRIAEDDLNVRDLALTRRALWVGTDRGLVRIDRRTGARALQTASAEQPAGLLTDDITTVMVDRQDVLWVGTRNGAARADLDRSGIAHVAPSPSGLASPMVFALLEDRRGDVWAGTDGGVFRHDRRSGTFTRYEGRPGTRVGLSAGGIRALLEADDGAIWVGTIGGVLNRLDPSTGAVRRYSGEPGADPTDPGTSFRVRALLQDPAGTIWIGAASGLYRLRRGEATPRRVARMNGTDQGNEVWALARDGQGVLWAGTETGLLRFDPRTGRAAAYRHSGAGSLPDETLVALHLGAGGDLWIGTLGHGLVRFDRRTGRVTRTVTASAGGLPNNTVYAVLPGAPGDLWVSTNLGLSRLTVATGRFETYRPVRGAQSDEFNAGASFRSASGELFFGGVNGYNAVLPGGIVENGTPPQVALTGLRVMNQRVGPSADGPLRDEIGVAREIVVRHDQNVLTLAFAGLHAAQPQALTFSYRLDGLDGDWQHVGVRRTATYTNLSPGTYTFRVRSRSASGVWSRDAAAIRVRVLPFWYETAWARALALLLLLGGLVLAVGARLRSAARREHALEATVAARTSELRVQAEALEAANADLAQTNAVVREAQDAQARFFETASHELRTPLSLTLGPLDDLRRAGALTGDAKATADLAHTNATRLARLVDDLLDTARLEAGEMPHRPRPADLARITTDVGARFADLAERDGVVLRVEAPPAVPAVVDATAVERALANLVANALRHTPAGGAVTIRLTAGDAEARIAVSDTGPGVPRDALPHLFERFYRADERAGVGSGLGLGLAREWTERHGGRVEAVSPPGEGATFTVVLPLTPETTLAPLGPPGAPVGADDASAEPVTPDADALVVLVAEDNADLRAYVARHLGRAFDRPVTVVEAADGEAALGLARDLVPDLVVSDVRMPRRDGLSLLRELKADVRTSHVPVLLLTARADAPAQAEGFAAGADGYLAKPFDAAVLRAQAATLVAGRQRLRDRLSALAGLDGHSGDGAAGEPRRGDSASGSEPAPPALSPAEVRFLTTVDDAITAGLGDAPFGVEALAETLALSPRQLRRKLRAVAGDTPADRIRRARVEAGAALIAAGTHSVKEAAAAVGYADAEGFRRAFVAVRGVQPSEAGLV